MHFCLFENLHRRRCNPRARSFAFRFHRAEISDSWYPAFLVVSDRLLQVFVQYRTLYFFSIFIIRSETIQLVVELWFQRSPTAGQLRKKTAWKSKTEYLRYDWRIYHVTRLLSKGALLAHARVLNVQDRFHSPIAWHSTVDFWEAPCNLNLSFVSLNCFINHCRGVLFFSETQHRCRVVSKRIYLLRIDSNLAQRIKYFVSFRLLSASD